MASGAGRLHSQGISRRHPVARRGPDRQPDPSRLATALAAPLPGPRRLPRTAGPDGCRTRVRGGPSGRGDPEGRTAPRRARSPDRPRSEGPVSDTLRRRAPPEGRCPHRGSARSRSSPATPRGDVGGRGPVEVHLRGRRRPVGRSPGSAPSPPRPPRTCAGAPRASRCCSRVSARTRSFDALVEADPGRDERQLGVVDARGRAAAFTGSKCMDWAGHVVGDGYACQGNILFGPAVVRAMARAYESTGGDIADRLLAALVAGQREGGDRRGQQSAALLVSKKGAGYGEGSDRWIDIRVDDHPSPIEELRRVFQALRPHAPEPGGPEIARPHRGRRGARGPARPLRARLLHRPPHGRLGRGEQDRLRPVHRRAQLREQADAGRTRSGPRSSLT